MELSWESQCRSVVSASGCTLKAVNRIISSSSITATLWSATRVTKAQCQWPAAKCIREMLLHPTSLPLTLSHALPLSLPVCVTVIWCFTCSCAPAITPMGMFLTHVQCHGECNEAASKNSSMHFEQHFPQVFRTIHTDPRPTI